MKIKTMQLIFKQRAQKKDFNNKGHGHVSMPHPGIYTIYMSFYRFFQKKKKKNVYQF